MVTETLTTDAVIIGAGLAGIVTAIELLEHGKRVVLVDRDDQKVFGGQAREALGGMTYTGTPQQARAGIKDSPDLAYEDWIRYGQFNEEDTWPKAWARAYVDHCVDDIYFWLRGRGLKFLPVITWGERGMNEVGNSVARYHLLWGGGYTLATRMIEQLEPHSDSLTLLFNRNVQGLTETAGRVSGCHGVGETDGAPFEITAENTIVATGGVGGDLGLVRKLWPEEWGEPPETLLTGAHKYSDGKMHQQVESIGGNVTHLSRMWNYATGFHHPKPRKPNHGLALLPPRSAIWADYQGKRIGPEPLMGAFDTRWTCERVSQQPRGYSWSILNRKVVEKELMISGSEHNPALRDRKLFTFLKENLLGNKRVFNYLASDEVADAVTASTPEELARKMNQVTGGDEVDGAVLRSTIEAYDAEVELGPELSSDPQIKRIGVLRQWKGDRPKVCNFQPIGDPSAGPLMAIRQVILCRKSLGGIQTDLEGRVLKADGSNIDGLYAVGEASGFGGGGSNGVRSLEGTFLAGCILTGRFTGRAIGGAG